MSSFAHSIYSTPNSTTVAGFREHPGVQAGRQNPWIKRYWACAGAGSAGFRFAILLAIAPLFYPKFAAAQLSMDDATAWFAYTQGIARGVAMLIAPIIGSIADIQGSKKFWQATFVMLGCVGTASLSLISEEMTMLASVFLGLGIVGASVATSICDSFLPFYAAEEDWLTASTQFNAISSAGASLLLIVEVVMILTVDIEENERRSSQLVVYQVCFLLTAVFWICCTLPFRINNPEPPVVETASLLELRRLNTDSNSRWTLVKLVFRRVGASIKELFKNSRTDLRRLLLASFFFNDGVSTLQRLALVYGESLGLDEKSMLIALILNVSLSVPFTLLSSIVAKFLGPKNTLMALLIFFMFIPVGAYYVETTIHYYILACAMALAQGGVSSLSMSCITMLAPVDRMAEMFGFYSVSVVGGGIFGPILFALMVQATGNMRLAVLLQTVWFAAGLMILSTVNMDRGGYDQVGDDEDHLVSEHKPSSLAFLTPVK